MRLVWAGARRNNPYPAFPLLIALALVAPCAASAQIATGSYTGTGVDNRGITGLGFQPDVVVIKGSNSQYAVVKTASMAGDASKMPSRGANISANWIQSLDADGFTVGTDASVNNNGTTYYWTAFKEIGGVMDVGSYTGNASTSRSITGVGFQPDLVWVLSASNDEGVIRHASNSGTERFRTGAGATSMITSLDSDGFSMGNSAYVNSNGVTYHYIAWKALSGIMAVGSYVGNASDNRSITVGFQPQYVFAFNGVTHGAVARPDVVAGDVTLDFDSPSPGSNQIQALETNGFQVGTATDVNSNGDTTYWAAWSANAIFNSAANGNWNASSSWTRVAGSDADGIPDDTDSAYILPAHTITLTADTSARGTRIGGTLVGGASTLRGSGGVVVDSAAVLKTALASGINGLLSTSGTKSVSTGAGFELNGSSAQVTGTTMPATVRNLTVNNAAGVTLSQATTVSGTLTMTSGNIATGSHVLALGTSTSSLGTLAHTSGSIVGSFRRWFSNAIVSGVLFPLGTTSTHHPATLSFTSAPTAGGTLLATFTASNPGTSGLPLTESSYSISSALTNGYWTLASANGLAGGAYSLDLQATDFTGISDYTKLRILKRANGSSAWTLNGVHAAGTGSASTPVLHRTGMSGFSDFGIGSGSDAVLPIELASFTAVGGRGRVALSWRTASEIENAGFEIERATGSDGPFAAIASYRTDAALRGLGTSAVGASYAYTDGARDPLAPGIYRYRLVDIAIDGTRTTHSPARVEVVGTATAVMRASLAPNPTSAGAALSVSLLEPQRLRVEVVAMTGEAVAWIEAREYPVGDHTIALPVAGLPSGVYQVLLEGAERVRAFRLQLAR